VPSSRYVLHDLIEQPGFNPSTQRDRGDWSLRDVSSGQVFAAEDGKPACIDHGAMNCVTENMSLWRCLMCGRATYTTPAPISWTSEHRMGGVECVYGTRVPLKDVVNLLTDCTDEEIHWYYPSVTVQQVARIREQVYRDA